MSWMRICLQGLLSAPSALDEDLPPDSIGTQNVADDDLPLLQA